MAKSTTPSGWHETAGYDARLTASTDVTIRSVTTLETQAKVLVKDMYFEGADVLHCRKGRFRFTVDGMRTIDLRDGEALVTYPDHHITVEALDRDNRLLYGILNGADVVDYLNQLGFYDGMRGRAEVQDAAVHELMDVIASKTYATDEGRHMALSFLTDILVTLSRNMRSNGLQLIVDAVRKIHANLRDRIVRMDPLCEQLRVSRAHLTRQFAEAGLESPAEFIRREQLRLAVSLLRHTRKPIGDVAREAGFVSAPHFATFIKRLTGKTALAIRRNA